MSSKFSNICDKIMSSVKLNEDTNGFISLKNTNKEPESSKVISPRIEDKEELSDVDLQKRNELVNKAKESIENSLDDNKELKDILDEIKNLTKEHEINKWVANEEKNTARLGTKDAQIFLQNNNICLSYKDKIHIFKSVRELHDWLNKHDFPLPENICLHESTLQEEDNNNDSIDQNKIEELKKLFGKNFFKWLRINYPNDPKYQPFFKDVETEECCTTSGGLGNGVSWFGNKKLNETDSFAQTWWSDGYGEPEVNRFKNPSQRAYALIQALINKKKKPATCHYNTMNPSINDMERALEDYAKGDLQIFYRFKKDKDKILNRLNDKLTDKEKEILNSDQTSIRDKKEILKKFDTNYIEFHNLIEELKKKTEKEKKETIENIINSKDKDKKYDFNKHLNILDYEKIDPVFNMLSNMIKSDNTLYDKNTNKQVFYDFITLYSMYTKNQSNDKTWTTQRAKELIRNYDDKQIKNLNYLNKKFKNINPEFNEFVINIIKDINNIKNSSQIISKESFKEELKKAFNVKDKTLTEDETPADFATGASGGTDAGNLDMNIDTSTDTSNVSTGDMSTDMDTSSGPTPPASFGDININTPAGNADYAPEDPNAAQAPIEPEEEFIIDDVKINNDTGEVRIVVKNKKTGETELKTLSEIDV